MNINLYANRILRPIAEKKKEDIFDSISITGMRASGGPGNISQPGPPSPPAPEDSQYPLIFGADLVLWVNGRATSTKTTSDIFQSVVTSFNSDDSNNHAFTCPTVNKPKFSKNWFFLPGGLSPENIIAVNAEKTPYRFLHDGSDFEIWFDIYIRSSDVTTSSLWTIIGNSDSTSGKTGFTVNFDNRSASSHTRALNHQAAKSSAGNFVINTFAENAIILDEWNRCRIKRTGTNVTIHVDTVQISSANNSNAPVVGTDPSDNLTLWGASTTASRYFRGLVRQIVVVNRNLTTQEVTDMYAYFDEGNKVIGAGDDAYVYGGAGQSNMLGMAGSPPAYLQDALGSYIYTNTGYQFLDFGVNQQANAGTQFGPELEFIYRMNLLKPGKIYLIKTGVSGSTLYLGSDGTSWNIGTGTTNGLIHNYNDKWKQALDILRYQLNRTIHILGFLWRQGEADSLAPNPYEGGGSAAIQAGYKDDLSDMYKLWIDSMIAWGYDTSKCRLAVSLVDVPIRDYNAEIIAASIDVCDNMRTDDPSYASKCEDGVYYHTTGFPTSDGTHFTNDGQVSQGLEYANGLGPHINE